MREFYKRQINNCTVSSITYTQVDCAKSIVERAKSITEDTNRKERLEVAECVMCYQGGKVGGSMTTTILCGLCAKQLHFSSTCVDVCCFDCAKQYNLCKHCGADIDLKQRKKNTRISVMKSWLRWLFRCCMDCGVKLDSSYDRGDVCKKCFDEFNGSTLEELFDDGQRSVQ